MLELVKQLRSASDKDKETLLLLLNAAANQIERAHSVLADRKRKAMMSGDWEVSHAISMAAKDIFGE